jgi:PAS domain S-box-containing protein
MQTADAASLEAWIERVSDGESRFSTECRRQDGVTVPCLITARRVEIGSGSVLLCTAREDEYKTLQERARRLAAIVETSDDVIVSKTLDGTILSWNPAAERLFGWTADEIVGQSVSRIVPGDRQDELKSILARLRRNERIDHHETVRVTRDGRLIDVSVSISPIRDDNGQVIGATKIGRDVTERRRLERQQREFLLLAAHELRTPLTSLKMSAQMLQRRADPDDQLIGWILNRIGHLEHLITDLVDAARFDSEPNLTKEEVDLVALAKAAVFDMQNRTDRHVIGLVAAEPSVMGIWDRIRIEQVISALLENAVTYTHDGEVEVRVERDGDTARLVVSDQGPGIAPELVPSLFNRFVRLEAPGLNSAPGLGLGLFHCRTLVEAHGGKIRLEPPNGRGATFVVTLPLR